MHGTSERKHGLRAALRSMLGALLASSPAVAAAADEPPPMVLAKTGYLYVGGKIDPSLPGSPTTGQMYVEYFIPKTLTHPYPIVMIHGGSQTGTNFTGTPDGREGWAQYFVRRGHAVYVVDQVARGRSAHFSQSQGKVADANLKRTEQRFTAPEKSNMWPQAAQAHAVAGQRPGWRSGVRPVLCLAISVAVELQEAAGDQPRRGDRIVRQDRAGGADDPFAVGHVHLADRRRAAESREGRHRGRAERPAGLRDRIQGRAGMVRRHGRQEASGLGEVPITYEPPLKDGEELAVVRQDKPDRADLVRCWQQAEPARKLPKLANIPMLIWCRRRPITPPTITAPRTG